MEKHGSDHENVEAIMENMKISLAAEVVTEGWIWRTIMC